MSCIGDIVKRRFMSEFAFKGKACKYFSFPYLFL